MDAMFQYNGVFEEKRRFKLNFNQNCLKEGLKAGGAVVTAAAEAGAEKWTI